MHPEPAFLGMLVRAAFGYVFLLVLLRLAGKRVLTEGRALDLVVAVILGDLVDDLFFAEVSGAQFAVAAATLIALEVTFSVACRLSATAERILEGEPASFLRDGALVESCQRSERLHARDAEMLLRQSGGIEREKWHQVAEARIEPDGVASILLHEHARPVQRGDLGDARVRRQGPGAGAASMAPNPESRR
ncbi:MAG TPA: YetF domain-containing protein [Candidatus Binatia bacterium]|nr:YetF domain-containing protein [Candidatus Binatia bacterium]